MTRKITDEEVAAIRRERQKDGTVWTVDAALRAEIARLQDERDAAFTRGVEAMREAAARACYDRASALDEGVSDDEAATDDEGYGRFQEALALEAKIRALKVAP